MTESTEAAHVLRRFWGRIDEQDWNGLAELLDPQLTARYVHTGERFDAAGLVRLNRDYPGRWHAVVEDLVSSGDRAVSHVVVSDATLTFHVASFVTARDGRVLDLVEIWTEAGATPIAEVRPAARA